ncbi:MAG: hypothetical protein K9H84_07535 [Bacteroidales bacterium]|nr:hypothetical protein [Bacteroidales bacterium]
MKNEVSNKNPKWYLHWAFILSVILLIALAWIYFSSRSTIRQLKNQHKSTIEQLSEDFTSYTIKSKSTGYELVIQTFSWAVRKEMLNNNLDIVNNYLNILVKDDEIEEIFLVDPNDTVLLSTDKKYEGSSFSERYDGKMLKVDKVHSFKLDKDTVFIVTPVFGYEQRLGTIVIKIKPEYYQYPNQKYIQ